MIEFNFTLVMTWINFLVLFVVLRKVLFLPILEIQEKRKKHMEGSKSLVSDSMKQAEVLEKQYLEKMQQLRLETNDIILKARQTALTDKKNKRAEAEASVAQKIETSRVSMEKEIEAARMTLPERAAGLASQIMSKIIHRPMTAPVGDVASFIAQSSGISQPSGQKGDR